MAEPHEIKENGVDCLPPYHEIVHKSPGIIRLDSQGWIEWLVLLICICREKVISLLHEYDAVPSEALATRNAFIIVF
jgi:hypothetical protein